ncbi:hypothetical protein GCM10027294_31120 [Marinactinospora endophytica]
MRMVVIHRGMPLWPVAVETLCEMTVDPRHRGRPSGGKPKWADTPTWELPAEELGRALRECPQGLPLPVSGRGAEEAPACVFMFAHRRPG